MRLLKPWNWFAWNEAEKRRSVILNLPVIGRVAVVRDRHGEARWFPGGLEFHSNLSATLRRNGKVEGTVDLGSGVVTNLGVLAMANDYAWSAQLNLATLALANQHATGTGGTGAAATDVTMQTAAAPTATTCVTGTQSLVSAANTQIYQSSAVLTYTGPTAVTEWGLHTLATLSSSTGTPFTGATATTWTDTASAQTASSATVRGLQQTIVLPGTTTVWGLNLSNTTHIGTIPAWYKVSDGTAGSTPGATEAFTIRPVLFDHKSFSVLNFINGDAVTWQYRLTLTSGG